MPSMAQHQDQVIRNKKLLSIPDFNSATTEYGDWVITIAFYTAIHLVERELAKLPWDSQHHTQREECMVACGGKLRAVLTDYKALKAASLRTRYHCHLYSTQDTAGYLQRLDAIEKVLGKVS